MAPTRSRFAKEYERRYYQPTGRDPGLGDPRPWRPNPLSYGDRTITPGRPTLERGRMTPAGWINTPPTGGSLPTVTDSWDPYNQGKPRSGVPTLPKSPPATRPPFTMPMSSAVEREFRMWQLAFRGAMTASFAFNLLTWLLQRAAKRAAELETLEGAYAQYWNPSIPGWQTLIDCWTGSPGVLTGAANGDIAVAAANEGFTFCCPPGATYATPEVRPVFQWDIGPHLVGAYYYVNWWHYHDMDIFGRLRYDVSWRFRMPKATWEGPLADRRLPGWQRYQVTGGAPQGTPLTAGQPAIWPQVFPELIPPLTFTPTAAPQPIPWRQLPKRRPFTIGRSPSETSTRGNSAPAPTSPTPNPGPNAPPWPPGPGAVTRPTWPMRRPPFREKRGRENKQSGGNAASKVGKALVRLALFTKAIAEAGLEGLDAVEALFKALPKDIRDSLGPRPTGVEMLTALMQNWPKIDWSGHWITKRDGTRKWSPGAAENLWSNLFEDMAYGMVGNAHRKQAREIFDKWGFQSPRANFGVSGRAQQIVQNKGKDYNREAGLPEFDPRAYFRRLNNL